MHAVFETIEFIFSYSLAFSAIAPPISNTEQANGTALLTKLLAWNTEDDGMSILGGEGMGADVLAVALLFRPSRISNISICEWLIIADFWNL